MKLYAALWAVAYEPGHFIGIFSSNEKAKIALNNCEHHGDEAVIIPIEVDQAVEYIL